MENEQYVDNNTQNNKEKQNLKNNFNKISNSLDNTFDENNTNCLAKSQISVNQIKEHAFNLDHATNGNMYTHIISSKRSHIDQLETQRINGDELQMNLFVSYIQKKVKGIRKLTGDYLHSPEFDEKLFDKMKTKENFKSTNSRRKCSIIFADVTDTEFFLAKERPTTPEKKSKINPHVQPSKTYNPIPKSSSNNNLDRVDPVLKAKDDFKPNSPKKRYTITSNENSIIKLPVQFATEDPDLKLLIELINEVPTDNGWKKVLDDPKIKIHKKNIKGMPQILIKANSIIDGFTKDEVFQAIADVKIRKEWDKVFSEFKIVDNNDNEGFEVLYMSLKSPSVFVKDRDFVQRRKIWQNFPNDQSHVLHFKSVDHQLCPLLYTTIRANTIISGYYIQTISVEPVQTLISVISQTDIKGSIPQWLVNKVSEKAPRDWVNNLIKGCGKIKAKNKK